MPRTKGAKNKPKSEAITEPKPKVDKDAISEPLTEQEVEAAKDKKTLEELKLTDVEIFELGDVKPRKILPAVKGKLATIGITDVMSLASANPETLMDFADIKPREKAMALIAAAQRLLQKHDIINNSMRSAVDVYNSRMKLLKLSTGSSELDRILKGGIETEAVTEIYAEFASGKTQLCFTLAVNATKPIKDGGLDSNVIWIDTEGTFRPERIEEIAKAQGLDPMEVLKKISHIRVINASHLEQLAKKLSQLVGQTKSKLVIVDSIIAAHRAEFSGRGTLADRQHKLGVIVHDMIKMSEFKHIAFVITNQVSANPDGFPGAPTSKVVGGNTVAHTTTYRLQLRKNVKNIRTVKIIDSPYHAKEECFIAIGPQGVTDVEQKEEKKDDSSEE